MTMPGHYRHICKHGRVVSQCRCPDGVETVVLCPDDSWHRDNPNAPVPTPRQREQEEHERVLLEADRKRTVEIQRVIIDAMVAGGSFSELTAGIVLAEYVTAMTANAVQGEQNG
jgi:hypothetical protein